MKSNQGILPSDKVKKALLWVSEQMEEKLEKDKTALMEEAQIRFDLSPADCAFLNRNFL